MYHNFIGVDISKADFAVAQHGVRSVNTFDNNIEGFNNFYQQYEGPLLQGLIIIETTGGYEMPLITFLLSKNIAVHRANARKVKYFIRSLGKEAKSDKIDALGLARYGFERQSYLELFVIKNSNLEKLQQLIQRRLDLNKMLVQEKNRKKAPNQDIYLAQCCETIIEALKKQLDNIEKEIEAVIGTDPKQKEKVQILTEIDGIGKIIANSLLALLPELGTVNRRQIASLVGLAPHPYESGQMIGYRKTKGGRRDVRCILFMAGMTAARSNGRLGEFYQSLIARGKKKMVAITALMRKIIVIANAKLSAWYKLQEIPI